MAALREAPLMPGKPKQREKLSGACLTVGTKLTERRHGEQRRRSEVWRMDVCVPGRHELASGSVGVLGVHGVERGKHQVR